MFPAGKLIGNAMRFLPVFPHGEGSEKSSLSGAFFFAVSLLLYFFFAFFSLIFFSAASTIHTARKAQTVPITAPPSTSVG